MEVPSGTVEREVMGNEPLGELDGGEQGLDRIAAAPMVDRAVAERPTDQADLRAGVAQIARRPHSAENQSGLGLSVSKEFSFGWFTRGLVCGR